jgi:excisionase family DNA binding protein
MEKIVICKNMKPEYKVDGYDGYCGTSYAAKLLNVSVGTIQNLVESNSLQAWKTKGGHRRISLQSIKDYQILNKLESANFYSNDSNLRVLVVEDDENTRLMYQAFFDRWSLPLDVTMYASAMEALIDMPAMRPQILLTDLNMPKIDGFKFLKTLREHRLFSHLPIIVMTGLSNEQIQERGGLPHEVQLLRKPIDMEWVRGFLGALISIRNINGNKTV